MAPTLWSCDTLKDFDDLDDDIYDINTGSDVRRSLPGRSGGAALKDMKPKLSIEKALEEAQRIKTLAESEGSVLADAELLAPLLKATVKFENMRPRSWKSAVESLWMSRPRIEDEASELIESFTKVFVRALREAPTASWAIESLCLLLDKKQGLYHSEVRAYKGSSNYDFYRGGGGTSGASDVHHGRAGDGRSLNLADIEEGAVFLHKAAMKAFCASGGDTVGVSVIKGVPPVQWLKKLLGAVRNLDAVVDDTAKLGQIQEAWASAAIEVVNKLPEETLLGSCEDVLATKDELDFICWNHPVLHEAVNTVARQYSLVMLRSTNLQGRRTGASEITDMGNATHEAEDRVRFSKWLADERVLEELFGDRLDERVLEKIEILPLMENTPEGLRPVLSAVYPQIGRPVVQTLLYNLCIANTVETPVVVALLEHVNKWLEELRQKGEEAEPVLQFVTAYFSKTTRELGTKHDRRIWTFMDSEAVFAGLEVVVASLLLPQTTAEQRIALEAALEDAKNHRVGDAFRETLLKRLMGWLSQPSDSDSSPASRHILTMLLRLLQSYPFAPASENDKTTSRQQVVNTLWKDGFGEVLWKELAAAVQCKEPVSEDDLRLRLRVYAYVHRCSPGVSVDAARLSELKELLAHRPTDFFYFLRIASVTAEHSPPNEGSFPALADEALQASLAMLHSLATESPLSMAGYFCLQNAIVLVGGAKGALSMATAAKKDMKPDSAVAMAAEPVPEELCKGRKPAIGDWVKITSGGMTKDGLLSKYDPVHQDYLVEYIDESTHFRDLSRSTWKFLPPLMEQIPQDVHILQADDPETLEGVSSLWSTVFNAPSDVADCAARFLLALHEAHAEVFLSRVLTELGKAKDEAAGRGIMLLQTMVKQSPPRYCVQRAARGFPVDVWVSEMVPKEMKDKFGAYTSYQKGQRVGLRVHSAMTLEKLQAAAAAKVGHRAVTLAAGPLGKVKQQLPCDGTTMMEADLAAGTELEATPQVSQARKSEVTMGPLDSLGSNGERMDSLMNTLLGVVTNSGLSDELSLRAWMLLKHLPLHEHLEESIASLDKDWKQFWAPDARGASMWRGVYAAHVVEALLCPSDANGPLAKNAETWRLRFIESGGFASLLSFLLHVCASEATPLEASRALPVLLRTVNACVVDKGPIEDAAMSILEHVPRAVQAVFNTSATAADEWDRLRLIYATGDGLHLLQSALRASLVPETATGNVLTLLLGLAFSTHSVVKAKVFEAMDTLIRLPGTGTVVLSRLTETISQGSASLYGMVLKLVENGFPPDVSMDARRALLRAVVDVVVGARDDTGGPPAALLRLLRVLLQDGSLRHQAGEVAGPIHPRKKPSVVSDERLVDRLLRFLFPPPPDLRSTAWPRPSDEACEAAASALLALVQHGNWDQQQRVISTATSFLAESPVPSAWDFETPKPVGSSSSLGFYAEYLNCVRNNTGRMGLLNRGNTCYMNSTMQQLFLCDSFRSAILQAQPPLPPKRGDADDKAEISDPGDVLRHVQRLFWFMQESETGVYITDPLVKACKTLKLEFPVERQNDASEFFDKLCDRLDETVKDEAGRVPAKPSAAFRVRESRTKHCLWCGFKEKTREQHVVRCTLTVKENETVMQSLEECLSAYTAPETMAGDNRVQCDSCNRKADTTYQTFFTQLPEVLALHLARMTFDMETFENVKLNHRVAFPLELDMAPYTEEGKDGDAVPGCRYKLCGVQIHSGGAGGGHYYSYGKVDGDKWLEFNDASVSEFSIDQLEAECFGGADDRGCDRRHSAYMLFYRCCDNKPYGGSTDAFSQAPLMQRLLTRELSTTQKAAARMRNAIFEEISAANSQLFRNRVLFSSPMMQLTLDMAKQAATSLENFPAEDPEQRVRAEEAVIRFASKAYFDVVLHARAGKRLLKEWSAQMKRVILAAPGAALWLLSCFAGKRDDGALGRSTADWMTSPILNCRDGDRREAFWDAIVTTAEVVAAQDPGSVALKAFLSHALRVMVSVDTATRAEAYGELWDCLTKSEKLLPVIAAHDQAVAELLLHFYLGAASPLPAPPAPHLHARTEAWSTEAGRELLVAIGRVNSVSGVSLSQELLSSDILWNALASRNPAELADGKPLRSNLPESIPVQLSAAQKVAAKLRPIGREDKSEMRQYQTALISLLGAPPDGERLRKLDLVMQHAKKLKVTADDNKSRGGGWGSSVGGSSSTVVGRGSGSLYSGGLGDVGGSVGGGIGPGGLAYKRTNAEAVQLLRILQAVAAVITKSELWSEEWEWATTWLQQAGRSSSSYDGVEIEEANGALAELKKAQAGPGKEVADHRATPDLHTAGSQDAREIAYLVFGAGTKDVNGKYSYDFHNDAGMPVYAHVDDFQLMLYKVFDKFYAEDARWVIERNVDAANIAAPPKKLYYTQFREEYAKDLAPPSDPDAWSCSFYGELPAPSVVTSPADAEAQGGAPVPAARADNGGGGEIQI
eukprot:TRINITY_DN72811_c0_g1_i1.p1 TRINITY_DN72811_c0_g1~~TRINITY_DN72811_c0_g1_i1.p1  ORF type:complete len:2471 (-),score=483.43 TRINITY_DN72811_c0_g1_i1:91-7461(-)